MIRLLQHPVYRREKTRLGFIRVWHWAILAVGLLAALLVAFRLMLCGRGTLPLMSIILAQEGLKEIMCLGAGVLGGAAARSDGEEGDLLRITPLAARAVVAAKMGAALQRLWLPIALVMLARLVMLIATLAWTSPERCQVVASALPYQFIGTFAWSLADVTMYVWWGNLLAVGRGPALPVWASYFILQSALDAALFSAAGLAAGSRWSAKRVAAALIASVALWSVGYLALDFMTQTFAAPGTGAPYSPTILYFIQDPWRGSSVSFSYLPLNLWTSGIPGLPYTTQLLPGRLMILVGGVLVVKVGLIAGLVRIAERGIGHD